MCVTAAWVFWTDCGGLRSPVCRWRRPTPDGGVEAAWSVSLSANQGVMTPFCEGLKEVRNDTQVTLIIILNLSLTGSEPRPLRLPDRHTYTPSVCRSTFQFDYPWRCTCLLVYCPSDWQRASPSTFTQIVCKLGCYCHSLQTDLTNWKLQDTKLQEITTQDTKLNKS